MHGLYFFSLENAETIYKQKMGRFCGEVLKLLASSLAIIYINIVKSDKNRYVSEKKAFFDLHILS